MMVIMMMMSPVAHPAAHLVPNFSKHTFSPAASPATTTGASSPWKPVVAVGSLLPAHLRLQLLCWTNDPRPEHTHMQECQTVCARSAVKCRKCGWGA